MFELGILPKIKGLYRRDYAKHMGFGGDEDTEFDAVYCLHMHMLIIVHILDTSDLTFQSIVLKNLN